MLDWKFLLVLGGAGLVSLWLMFRLVTSRRSRWEKVGGIVLLAVPVAGPLLYWFVYTSPPPQHPLLRGNGTRGEFLHRWIGVRPILEAGLKGQRDKGGEERQDGKDE